MATKLTDGVYFTGVLNPSLRIFDIVMPTAYGTSYNSYLVQGSEHTALIETAHPDYFDYFLKQIESVCPVSELDYVVMNHNEPDHSGSLVRLLEMNPNITVLATGVGVNYLKNITNKADANMKAVKAGDTLELGGKTLTFIPAPFLHWPDSMFTWLEQDKTLFSCDFLGCHFCEPEVLDKNIHNTAAYDESLKGYYDAIFGPFGKFVQQGLAKLEGLDIQMACTSHGPVLTKGSQLEHALESYRAWSTPAKRERKQIPIFYCTAYGNTGRMAEAIAEGIREQLPDADVQTYDIIQHDMEQLGGMLNGSDAFLIGSPTLNRDAVPPVWNLLSHIDAVNIVGRPVALFGSYGWSGEACANLAARLQPLKVKLFDQQDRVLFVPSAQDLDHAKEFGRSFAAGLA